MSDKVSEKTKNYELVPPDGGWGYLVCLAFIINCSSVTVFGPGCFGLLYNDFMAEIEMNSTGATLLNGMGALFFAMSGFFTSSLLKLMSFRQLGFLAIILHDIGMIGMVFAKSIHTFYIFQGFFMPIGVGTTFNLAYSCVNDYFVKRRMFAFSIGQFFIAINAMVAPMFVKWALEEYGYRGTLLLVAGISMHNIVGVALMQPVTMHMKRVEVPPIAEMQPFLIDEKSNTVPTVKLTDEEKATPTSEENVNGLTIDDRSKSAVRRVLEAFIDIDFAKKFILSCACTGPAICSFANITFALILPQALFAMNWNQDQVALAISTHGFGDLAMRTVLIFFGQWILKIGTEEVYVLGIILACISRFCMLWSTNVIAIFFYIFLMGVAQCILLVLISMVISGAAPGKNFTDGMGLNMMFSGIFMLVLGPAVGAVRDLTNSYSTAFYLLTSFFIIVAIFWTIELCYKKNKEKRRTPNGNLENKKSSRLSRGK